MKTTLIHFGLWSCILLLPAGIQADDSPSLSNAVPLYNLVIPVPASQPDYGWTVSDTLYDYVGRSPLGHEVLLETEAGTTVARIPFRDEWGRITVDSSEFNPRLEPGTVLTRVPVPMSPGSVILQRDQPYPATLHEDGRVIVHYTFRHYATNVAVSGSSVRFPVPPESGDVSTTNPSTRFEWSTEPSNSVQTALPPVVQPLPGQRRHAGIGAAVTASSTHAAQGGEGPPEALVDGMLTTRWSSEYTEPQHVIITFQNPIPVRQINLYWETASAIRYAVSTSIDGATWQAQPPVTKQVPPEPRTDEIPLTGTAIKAIRIDLLTRINPNWGFSLYEVEVVK